MTVGGNYFSNYLHIVEIELKLNESVVKNIKDAGLRNNQNFIFFISSSSCFSKFDQIGISDQSKFLMIRIRNGSVNRAVKEKKRSLYKFNTR